MGSNSSKVASGASKIAKQATQPKTSVVPKVSVPKAAALPPKPTAAPPSAAELAFAKQVENLGRHMKTTKINSLHNPGPSAALDGALADNNDIRVDKPLTTSRPLPKRRTTELKAEAEHVMNTLTDKQIRAAFLARNEGNSIDEISDRHCVSEEALANIFKYNRHHKPWSDEEGTSYVTWLPEEVLRAAKGKV